MQWCWAAWVEVGDSLPPLQNSMVSSNFVGEQLTLCLHNSLAYGPACILGIPELFAGECVFLEKLGVKVEYLLETSLVLPIYKLHYGQSG